MAAKLEYVGIAMTPPALFVFALCYCRWRRLLGLVGVLILIVPTITLGLALTNEGHELIWAQLDAGVRGLPALVTEYGAWYSIHTAYSYLLVAVAVGLIIWRFSQSPHLGVHMAMIAGAPLVVMAFNVLYIADINPLRRLDPTPIGFSVGAVLIGLAVFRYRLFDLQPVARDAVFDRLDSVVLVIDPQDRIADLNPAAEALIRRPSREVIGADAAEVLPEPVWQLLSKPAVDEAHEELTLESGGRRQIFDVSVIRLGQDASASGRLLTMLDLTVRVQAAEELERARTELERANRELEELANHDPLTGLANRRHFMTSFEQEVARSHRFGNSLALVMIDLDRFKLVNDTYGHGAGDQVLVGVAEKLHSGGRATDVVARIGGEEFAVLLVETPREAAGFVTERLRRSIAALRFEGQDGEPFGITASLGVALMGEDGATTGELLHSADDALYRAKELGRNRVAYASVTEHARRVGERGR